MNASAFIHRLTGTYSLFSPPIFSGEGAGGGIRIPGRFNHGGIARLSFDLSPGPSPKRRGEQEAEVGGGMLIKFSFF